MPKRKKLKLSEKQYQMLSSALKNDGVVTLRWNTKRTAISLARRELGIVCRQVQVGNWGIHGDCFVINEVGKEALRNKPKPPYDGGGGKNNEYTLAA